MYVEKWAALRYSGSSSKIIKLFLSFLSCIAATLKGWFSDLLYIYVKFNLMCFTEPASAASQSSSAPQLLFATAVQAYK